MSNDKHLRCSFCGKSKDSVRKFISGPSVYICNECITLCNEILAEDEEREVADSITQVPTPSEIKDVLDQYVIGQDRAKKTLAVAAKDDEPYYGTDAETVLAGKYPLSRFLYIYVNRKPGTPLDPLVHEFLAYVLSRDGQQIVVKDGYLPLPASVIEAEIGKIAK